MEYRLIECPISLAPSMAWHYNRGFHDSVFCFQSPSKLFLLHKILGLKFDLKFGLINNHINCTGSLSLGGKNLKPVAAFLLKMNE
jgi:hypothetical protein